FNPAAGVYDHSDPDLVLDFTAGACKIGVSLPNGQTSIQLATPTSVTATVTGNDCGVSKIYWSAAPIPGYIIKFDPVASDVSATSATTQVTITGPNTSPFPSVTIYARGDNPAVPIGSGTFPVTAAGSVPAG
ncbi:hypothetical protein DUT91_25240, partial [Phyllobacterium salinisoli]